MRILILALLLALTDVAFAQERQLNQWKLGLIKAQKELVRLQGIALDFSEERAGFQGKSLSQASRPILGRLALGTYRQNLMWAGQIERNLVLLRRRIIAVKKSYVEMVKEYDALVMHWWEKAKKEKSSIEVLKKISSRHNETILLKEILETIRYWEMPVFKEGSESPKIETFFNFQDYIVMGLLVLGSGLALVKGLKRE